MKLLCTADIHIGRTSSHLINRAPDTRSITTVQMWRDIVQCAIDNQVNMLLIAGDIVDRDNRYFEAFGPLEEGFRRLAENQIVTVAVAGNHDVDVFPRLNRAIDHEYLHLLGHNGVWERYTCGDKDDPLLYIDGWSFPSQHVLDSPLSSYDLPPSTDVPVLCLLHGDLDQSSSQYAPITKSAMTNYQIDCWLLGHIHSPSLGRLANGSYYLYPGSPLAMDPGERGQHGPWLIELQGRTFLEPRQIALSRVRYVEIEISLSGFDNPDLLQPHISSSIRDQLIHQIRDPGHLEYLSCRLRLTGRTSHRRNLPEILPDLKRDFALPVHDATAFIERIVDDTKPEIDINELAREKSPPGLLASLLLELESGELSPKHRDLREDVKRQMAGLFCAKPYVPLLADDDQPGQVIVHDHLTKSATKLLDILLTQREQT